ncbi:hypothetical protein [Pseudomonas nitroreducens]|uniref:hypothetical protein n=1 Tax=Pseudomonas nitroreducens TaxID=46680 RepID=UPI001FB57DAA|nr:hypothetical protein [Pseudomonas nitroreducens]MCJ1880740.1 hypothetical protein [Pseudomonas nitroreducens]MCJ1895742.1 hypothetical protein [Pseudomonas nitroreducens]
MNWQRLYAIVQIFLVHIVSWVLSVVFFAYVFSAVAKLIFGLEEKVSYLYCGVPAVLLFSVVYCLYMPASLRKAGVLSDDPRKFGPWFK